MKILLFKIPKTTENTFIVQEDYDTVFYNKFHQHPEIQLSLIVSGKGIMIVGDTIMNYEPNDILVFGSNVPHVLKSEISEKKSHMISLFFTKDAFGDHFFELPEFQQFSVFLKNTLYGLKVVSDKRKLKKLFFKIKLKDEKLDRLLIFIKMLGILKAAKISRLSSFNSEQIHSDYEEKRITKVFESVMNDFKRDFSLKEAADIANMTPNAFCRYFKQQTNKTFFQFLIEVRIENVCKLLSKESEMSISEASFLSGFKNISNFNRKFKEIKEITPSAYKKILNDSHFI